VYVEVELKDVVDHPLGATPVLILKEKDGQRVCCIDVGWFEANTIADQMEGISPPRPLAHDLLLDVMSHVGSRLQGIYIEKEQASTYFASVRITRPDGRATSLDARPSDAITLALKQQAPIYLNEVLFSRRNRNRVGQGMDPLVRPKAERSRQRRA